MGYILHKVAIKKITNKQVMEFVWLSIEVTSLLNET